MTNDHIRFMEAKKEIIVAMIEHFRRSSQQLSATELVAEAEILFKWVSEYSLPKA